MKIAHFVGHSMVRQTPGRIATYWGRYTEHEAYAFSTKREGGVGWCEPLNPCGFYRSKAWAKLPVVKWLGQCDVVHCHDDVYPTGIEELYGVDLRDKVLVYHAHIGSIPERYFPARGSAKFRWSPRVKHAAITNGYGHIFDDHSKALGPGHEWGRLPDILDLGHPAYAPEPGLRADPGPMRVCYTYSNNHEGGRINAKRPRAHMRLIGRVSGIESTFVYKVPFEEAMAIKKRSHVVIEECFTPYLHLSALEGAAVGACVVTKFDARTVTETSRALGAPESEWPFLYADESTLPDVLCYLRDNPDVVSAYGEKGREWMCRYYGPRELLRVYEGFYAA